MQWDLFKETVRQMREVQRQYFRTRERQLIDRARVLETAVDKMIADDDDTQQTLFNLEDVGNG